MRKILSRSSPWRSLLSRSHSQSRPLQTVAYEEIPNPNPNPSSTALVLHGLLGSGRNWRSFSKNLSSRISGGDDWRMVLVDLRNHGRSASVEVLDPPHNMESAARDLARLVEAEGWDWPDVVVGHSMGGKVALEFAASLARGEYGESAVLPKQLWILDSVPGEVNSKDSDGEVKKVLCTLQSLPPSLPSRKWVVDHMIELGFSKPLSEWIGSNLKKEGEHVTWSFNLQGAIEMFNSYCSTSYWSFLEQPPMGLEIAIVQAENSDRWHPPVLQKLESLSKKGGGAEGKVSLHVLPNSGHWVHMDNPKGLLDIMAPRFYSKA
ncbi:protein ABHD11 [Iris pallida]|uniref:Protein ABHD11 n=1 Tax=Iris pallida TaxID=29817 RepID=A0AAX6DXU8_IRIPA|nr:protein ABHD11 [Iris pallida]